MTERGQRINYSLELKTVRSRKSEAKQAELHGVTGMATRQTSHGGGKEDQRL